MINYVLVALLLLLLVCYHAECKDALPDDKFQDSSEVFVMSLIAYTKWVQHSISPTFLVIVLQGSGETGKSKWKKSPFTTTINSKQWLVSILITVVDDDCFARTLC